MDLPGELIGVEGDPVTAVDRLLERDFTTLGSIRLFEVDDRIHTAAHCGPSTAPAKVHLRPLLGPDSIEGITKAKQRLCRHAACRAGWDLVMTHRRSATIIAAAAADLRVLDDDSTVSQIDAGELPAKSLVNRLNSARAAIEAPPVIVTPTHAAVLAELRTRLEVALLDAPRRFEVLGIDAAAHRLTDLSGKPSVDRFAQFCAIDGPRVTLRWPSSFPARFGEPLAITLYRPLHGDQVTVPWLVAVLALLAGAEPLDGDEATTTVKVLLADGWGLDPGNLAALPDTVDCIAAAST